MLTNPGLTRPEHDQLPRTVALVLGAPRKKIWDGPNGTIMTIVKALKLSEHKNRESQRVRHTLEQVYKNLYESKTRTNGVTNPIQLTNRQNSSNEFRKEEIELLADLTEAGLSLRNTTAVLNNIRRQKNMKDLSKSSLHRMTCKLKPIRRSILKIPKGSFDKYSNWCKARKTKS